jgi:hypothetical protein
VRIEAGSRDDNPQHGTLFIVGLDDLDQSKVRLDEIVVASDRTFASPRTARNSGGSAPAWADDASAPPAFFVWCFVESSSTEEILFGGGDKLFTVPMQPNGLGVFASPLANLDGVYVQQAADIDATRFAIDDGTDVYIVPRGPATDPIDLPAPLAPTGTGAPDGAVHAAHDTWWAEVNVLGVRAPRHQNAPAQTSIQLFDLDRVYDKPLSGVAPTATTGPFLTGGIVVREVGDLGLVLAAPLTTFDGGGGPTTQQLVMTKLGQLADPFVADQFVALEPGVLPALTGGKFRAAADRNLLVIYPRRRAAEPPTHSVCYEALNAQCLARCGDSICAP